MYLKVNGWQTKDFRLFAAVILVDLKLWNEGQYL